MDGANRAVINYVTRAHALKIRMLAPLWRTAQPRADVSAQSWKIFAQ